MKPCINIFEEDGETEIGAFCYDKKLDGDYLLVEIDVAYPEEILYVEVYHEDRNAGSGLYEISAGPPLPWE